MSYISDYEHGGDPFEYEQCCAEENRKDRIEREEYYREEDDDDPEHCDHGVCVGDCDLCDQGEERAIQNLCDILAGYLDRHPDKVIFSTVHIVDCKWKHEMQIVDKGAKVK